MRPVAIEPGFVRSADGSALYSQGETRVICTASITDDVPRFLKGSGQGWVTAEYGMLPASTGERRQRDVSRGRLDGRSTEIQRLIGRSLRGVVDLESLGERTIILDCDVLEADGGTRTASVTGACVALHQALSYLVDQEKIPYQPMKDLVSAVSVGILGSQVFLDLCYEEDSRTDVDLNVVMTGGGEFVEIQGTAEGRPFSQSQLVQMLEAASVGCKELIQLQRKALGLPPDRPV